MALFVTIHLNCCNWTKSEEEALAEIIFLSSIKFITTTGYKIDTPKATCRVFSHISAVRR